MALRSIRVTDGDNLQNLAMRLLGDTTRWSEIAVFNRLHSPYISNDILDYYGTPSSKGQIVAPIDKSAFPRTFILNPTPNESAVEIDGTLLISQRGSDGELIYDVLPISEYDPLTLTISTTLSPAHSYGANSYWYIYPSEIPTHTARTGDLLYISDNQVTPVRSNEKFYDINGTDILLDDHGRLSWTTITVATGTLRVTNVNLSGVDTLVLPQGTYFAHNASGQIYQSSTDVTITPSVPITFVPVSSVDNGTLGEAGKGSVFTLVGTSVTEPVITALRNATILAETLLEAPFRPADMALVSGAENVRQALINRIGTRKGELVYHPNYGNLAYDQIGAPNEEAEQTLIEAYTIDCMKEESRISKILAGHTTRSADSMYISAQVEVRDTGRKLLIDDVRLRLIDDISNDTTVVGR